MGEWGGDAYLDSFLEAGMRFLLDAMGRGCRLRAIVWMQWAAGVACGRGLEFGWCFVTGMSYGEGILGGVCMEAARRSCRGCQAFVQTEEEAEERK